MSGFALSLLRFVAGLAFLEHGLAKLVGFPPGPVAFRHMMHLPPLLLAAGWIETVGGVLVCLGLFTRPAAFLMSGEMAVAYFMVHEPRSFFPILSHGEPALLYCFIFFYLAVVGGGPASLARMLCGARGRAMS
ncbi:MAG: DoxX family protein [Rhodospirillales bacterium]|nr:DoxX family protein [Rhodospirillales bacterium]